MNTTENVLIMGPNPDCQGGVSYFVSTLIQNASPQFFYHHFETGRNSKKKNKISHLLKPLSDSIRLISSYSKRKFRYIHINPSLNFNSLLRDGLFILTLKAVKAKNIVVFFHGWDTGHEKMIKENIFLKYFFKKIFEKASIIIVLGSCFKKSLIEMGFAPEKIIVSYTMFDGRIFKDLPAPPNKSSQNIVFLSRLIKEKGIYELLEAFLLLSPQYTDLKMTIAGDGPETQHIKKWIQEKRIDSQVELPGFIKGAAKASALKNAGIFVFPSFYGEGCPISLLEAMAAGLPVITTPAGGITDIFENEKNGIIIYNNTPAEIASAIERLIGNKNLYNKIASTNHIEAWNIFEAGPVAKKMESIYRDLQKQPYEQKN